MNLEHKVAAHYGRGKLEEQILGMLRSAGKDHERLSFEDLAAIDEFHLGGREATQALADFMPLRPGMHLWTWVAASEARRATLPAAAARSRALT